MLQKENVAWASVPESELERELFSSLNPVKPDPVFVDRLEARLKTQSVTVLEPASLLGAYLVIASGLFGGALLLWLLHVIFSSLWRLNRR
jgi:hypothetical protein